MAQRQVPGSAFVNETAVAQYQIPGGPLVHETISTHAIPLSSGSFALSGKAVGFTYLPIRILPAAGAAFVLNGNASFVHGYRIVAAKNDFILSVAPSLSDHQVTAVKGTFTLTGNTAGLTHGYKVTADKGTFTFTGNEVVFKYDTIKLTAESGAFTLTGTAIRRDIEMSAATGSFTLTAGLIIAETVFTASSGQFTLSGQAVTLTEGARTRWSRSASPSTSWTRIS